MTSKDVAELSVIMGDRPVNGATLGSEVLRWYREFQQLMARHVEVVDERDRLKRRISYLGTRRPSKSREAELMRELAAKQRALDFAVSRNEVLRRKAR